MCVYTFWRHVYTHSGFLCIRVCRLCIHKRHTRRMCVYAGFVFLTEPTPTAGELATGTSTRTFLAYCAKGCTHTSTRGGGQGCRRPFNPDTAAGFGYCNPDKQVKCFYPENFNCKCTSDNRSSELSKRQPCVCPAADFEKAVGMERALRDAAKRNAAAHARTVKKLQQEAEEEAQLLLTDEQAADLSAAWGGSEPWSYPASGGVRAELDRDFNVFLEADLASLEEAENGQGVSEDGTGPSEYESKKELRKQLLLRFWKDIRCMRMLTKDIVEAALQKGIDHHNQFCPL